MTQALEAATVVREQRMAPLPPSIPLSALRQHAQPAERTQLAEAAARLALVSQGVRQLHR